MAGSDTNHVVSLSLTNPAQASPRHALRLEQEAWGKGVGVVSKVDAVNFIVGVLYGTGSPIDPDCGMNDDGSISCIIYAYPDPSDLNHKLHTSHGVITGKKFDMLEESEGIRFDNSADATLRHTPHSVISKKWHGDVYDISGNQINKPTITITGKDVHLSAAVVGTLIVTYKIVRFEHTLKVYPRITAAENKYASTVYGLYKNGIAFVETNAPRGADQYDADVKCGWNSTTRINSGGDPDGPDGEQPYEPPTASGDDRKQVVDYCTQEIISDSID